MEKNRSRLEITRDMLAAVAAKRGEIKPTHLMYKSNLSHSQMQKYLGDLIENGFLERKASKDRELIAITDKGYQLLHKMEDMLNFQQGFNP